MLFKLALGNISRSVRDYAIYFVTLLLGVAVFYAFNSIGSQKILFDLEQAATERIFDATQDMLGGFSVAVAFVLAFLIIYANRFLIRRRKREFGTYLVLGMKPSQVSRIVLYETAAVGIVSLAVGLVMGVLLSQALSFATAALFGMRMTQYQFVFSPDALWRTIGCFALIYVVVALLNTTTIARCKIGDLLAADAKSERTVMRNPKVCLAVFIASVALLAFAYEQLLESGMVELDDPRFLRATVCMLVGTLALFWSLSGFAIALLTRTPSVYLRGLRPFTMRQIAGKVNTAFVSLWVVCVLLFLSIATFSCGMGMVEVFTDDVEQAVPYSATVQGQVSFDKGKALAEYSDELDGWKRGKNVSPEEQDVRAEELAQQAFREAVEDSGEWDMAAVFQAAEPQAWEQTVGATAQASIYSVANLTYGELFAEAGVTSLGVQGASDFESASKQEVDVLSVSQLNEVRALSGEAPVKLGADECLMVNNLDMTSEAAFALAGARLTIDVAGKRLTFCDEVCDTQVQNNAMKASILLVAVPDEAMDALVDEGAVPSRCLLNVVYAENGKTIEENDAVLKEIVEAALAAQAAGNSAGGSAGDGAGETGGAIGAWGAASLALEGTYLVTQSEMISQSAGLKFMITYLALYIGLAFLMSTAAVLAVQQLSDTVDSLGRYRTLYRLGCDERMVRRSLLAQIALYFLAPLVVALSHAACAITALSDSLFAAFGVELAGPICMAAVLVVVVYGGYMLVTYACSRSIIQGAQTARA